MGVSARFGEPTLIAKIINGKGFKGFLSWPLNGIAITRVRPSWGALTDNKLADMANQFALGFVCGRLTIN